MLIDKLFFFFFMKRLTWKYLLRSMDFGRLLVTCIVLTELVLLLLNPIKMPPLADVQFEFDTLLLVNCGVSPYAFCCCCCCFVSNVDSDALNAFEKVVLRDELCDLDWENIDFLKCKHCDSWSLQTESCTIIWQS